MRELLESTQAEVDRIIETSRVEEEPSQMPSFNSGMISGGQVSKEISLNSNKVVVGGPKTAQVATHGARQAPSRVPTFFKENFDLSNTT